MSLEEIEKKLYKSRPKTAPRKKRKPKIAVPKIEREVIPEIPKVEEGVGDKNLPLWFKFVIAAAALFVVVIGGSVYFIFRYASAPRDVGVEVALPREVYRGVPFEVSINISNGSENILKNAILALSYTDGLVSLDGNVFSETLGDIGSGSLSKKTYRFLAIGNDGREEKITAALSYTLGAAARFEASGAGDLKIKGPAIELEVKPPEKILGGSAFGIEIVYKNVSDFDFGEVALEAKYPNGFKYISSDLTPSSLNNYWRLGELKRGSSGTLEVRGFFDGPDEESFSIPVVISASFLGEDYKVVEKSIDLVVAPSPIKIEISVNGRADYTARLGDTLNYMIKYQNLSGIALANMTVTASLSGEMFDFKTLSSDGSFDSLTNKLTWNASNVPSLRLVDPGLSGLLSFSIKLKNQFPIQRLSDKNFSLRLSVEIDSPSVPYYLTTSKTRGLATFETKIAGFALLSAQAFYRDAASGILNTGSFPPQVNKATDYTIHWIVRNYSTDIKNVEISAGLPAGVSWSGQVKSNIDSVPLYNEETREVVWKIDRISATRGVLSDPIEAIFQVRAVPSPAQAGSFQPLLAPSTLKATDDFTGLPVSAASAALDTALIYDRTVAPGEGRVIP